MIERPQIPGITGEWSGNNQEGVLLGKEGKTWQTAGWPGNSYGKVLLFHNATMFHNETNQGQWVGWLVSRGVWRETAS